MARALVALSCATAALAGCGHPASVAECDEILELSALIVLRSENVTDPEVVRERTQSFRELRGPELLKGCVGKRITDRAMRCMRAAASAEEFDGCLD
ncbi:MAG: hypothetical protein IT373_06055 [Polyangiaceae bacterium]|nr:hypothetical protein [Polyangiaceae bacterium]